MLPARAAATSAPFCRRANRSTKLPHCEGCSHEGAPCRVLAWQGVPGSCGDGTGTGTRQADPHTGSLRADVFSQSVFPGQWPPGGNIVGRSIVGTMPREVSQGEKPNPGMFPMKHPAFGSDARRYLAAVDRSGGLEGGGLHPESRDFPGHPVWECIRLQPGGIPAPGVRCDAREFSRAPVSARRWRPGLQGGHAGIESLAPGPVERAGIRGKLRTVGFGCDGKGRGIGPQCRSRAGSSSRGRRNETERAPPGQTGRERFPAGKDSPGCAP